MTVNEFYKALEKRFPVSLSCDWDRDGKMVLPDGEKEVKRVLCCLDCDNGAAKYALTHSFDLILTHHPLIFHSLPALVSGDPVCARSVLLYEKGISVLSFHTRMDCAEGGINDTLAEIFRLKNTEPLFAENLPMGRIGDLQKEMTGRELGERVKEELGCVSLRLTCPEKRVKRLAVLGGAGGEFFENALRAGADAFLTGEARYHEMLGSAERGLCLLAAGHDFTEMPGVKRLVAAVQELSPGAEAEFFGKTGVFPL